MSHLTETASPPVRPAPAETDPVADTTEGRARTGFWLYAGHLYAIFGIALSNTLLGLSILASPFLGTWRSALTRLRIERAAPFLGLLTAYALLLPLSVAFSDDPGRAAEGLSELFNLATLVLAFTLVRDERDVRRVVDGLVIVAGVVAVWGLGQYFLGMGDIDRRIRGPFSHYMTFAGFLGVADMLLAASLLWRRGRRQWWRWPLLVVINLALLGSLTRSAWIGVVVAFTLLALIRKPKLLFAYVPAAVLLLLLAPATVVERITSIADLTDLSNYDRLCMIDAGAHMVAERPFLGLGPEMVQERYPLYRPPSAPRFQVPHLHNSFLQLAAERGLPTLLAYLGMMALSMATCWRRYRKEGGAQGPRAELLLGILVALIAFNLAGLFENNWGDTEVQRPVLFLMAAPFLL